MGLHIGYKCKCQQNLVQGGLMTELEKTPGRVEALRLIDAHLAECPCRCVKALQLALAKEIVKAVAED